MREKLLFLSLFILGCACIGAAMVIMENRGRDQSRQEIIDIVRREQRACQDANVVLQEYQRAKDCSVYGDMLSEIINPEG